MRKHSFQAYIWKFFNLPDQICALLCCRKSEPFHPCIDLDMKIRCFPQLSGKIRNLLCHIQCVYCGAHLFFYHFFILIREYTSQHHRRFLNSRSVKLHCFFQSRSRIAPYIRIVIQHTGNRNRTMSISVCFHYGNKFCAFSNPLFHLFHVI